VGFTGGDGGTVSTQEISFQTPTAQPIKFQTQMVGGNLVISWPVSTGAYLQSTSALNPSSWATDTTDQFQIVGNLAQVTVTPSGGDRFFRLQLFP